jgi:S1-C subfamily serine protease
VVLVLVLGIFLSVSFGAEYSIGDKINDVLFTDIITEINGQQIESFNINGSTAVYVNSAKKLGYDVIWDGEKRLVTIKNNVLINPIYTESIMNRESFSNQIGDKINDVLYTDIKTVINGEEVESFNINGYTAIYANALENMGASIKWVPDKRMVMVSNITDNHKDSSIPQNITLKELKSTSAKIYWDEVEGADYYFFYYQEDGEDGFWLDEDDEYIGGMRVAWDKDYSVGYSNLEPNTKYNVIVTAIKKGIESEDSEIFTFKTSKLDTSIPQNLHIYSITDTEALINWDEVEGADYYYVYYQNDGEDTFWYDESDEDDDYTGEKRWYWEKNYSIAYGKLEPNTIYNVRVTSVKDGVESEDSEILSFITPSELNEIREVKTSTEIGELADSVVKIEIVDGNNDEWEGSGFFYNNSGGIITNFHVIEGLKSIKITDNSDNIYSDDITILGFRKGDDIAIIDSNIDNKSYIKFDTTNDIKMGNKIYTIGSPRGLKNTLSDGIVSAIREDRIQISAPITYGSSGGVLLNEYGEALGITSEIYENSGDLGFAIPINEVLSLYEYGYTMNEFNLLSSKLVEHEHEDSGIYYGVHKNNKCSGYGEYYWADGLKYVGEFTDGMKTGFGTIIWPDGEYYQGNWSNDMKNGYGKYICNDGYILKGIWENNEFMEQFDYDE